MLFEKMQKKNEKKEKEEKPPQKTVKGKVRCTGTPPVDPRTPLVIEKTRQPKRKGKKLPLCQDRKKEKN